MTHNENIAPRCATIGFFDGVHCGHRYLISQLRDDAARHGMESLVVTFRQHPRQVLQQDYIPKLLTTSDRKEELLLATGVDHVTMLDFSLELANLSARQFMSFLHDKYNVRRLLIGYDNRFGHNRDEGFEDYRRHGIELGIEVECLDALQNNGTAVSSSMIRRLLNDGDVAAANVGLGYRYSFSGTVVHGFGEGRKLGFPTANLHIADEQFVPKNGVYAVMVTVEGFEGEFMGMMNIGNRPTYGTFSDTLEVNIIDFDADIYDRQVQVAFVDRIRDVRKFDSVAQLQEQLAKDKNTIIKLLRQ